MFTRPIDAVKGLLVCKKLKAVGIRHLLHDGELLQIMVVRQVGFLVNGRDLELVGRHLVMPSLAGDAAVIELGVKVFHETQYRGLDLPEVVVFQWRATSRQSTKKR